VSDLRRLPFGLAPLPGGNGMWIRPQTPPTLAGIVLGNGKLARLVVNHISPSEPVVDHFHVDESLAQIDAAHLPLESVDVDHLDSDGLLEHLRGQRFPRLRPKRLPILRRVDAGQANLVLNLVCVEDRDRVPVTQRDAAAVSS